MGIVGRIINWVKQNKLATVLILIVVYLYWNRSGGITPFSFSGKSAYNTEYRQDYVTGSLPGAAGLSAPYFGDKLANISLPVPGAGDYPPTPGVADRKVIQESQISLLTKNVSSTVKQVVSYVEGLGGYMVNTFVSNPNEDGSGSVTIRIPAKELAKTLEYFRSLAVKVVSENLWGTDVTDQYVDIESRLATLYKTKAKYEEILDRALRVEEILNVQREIINLQSQIDALKGQQQYLDKSAEMAKITVYLSTDELALPYPPSEPWRPDVIFKQAVRSLIGTLRDIGSFLIWAGVYAVLWVPVLAGFIIFRRMRKPRI